MWLARLDSNRGSLLEQHLVVPSYFVGRNNEIVTCRCPALYCSQRVTLRICKRLVGANATGSIPA